MKSINLPGALTLGLFCCSAVSAQVQQPPLFSRDYCVKVKDGKSAEYAQYLQDVTVKIAKVRVDEGLYLSYTIAQAVVPSGRAARCDYHLVTTYSGFPPDLSGTPRMEADMKKAGITMSRAAAMAKRDELSSLVSEDIWRWFERVGTSSKGSYARLNYYKAKPGAMGDWVRGESTGWKLLAESVAKDMPGTGWRAATLSMPGGTGLPYNAMTVDVFPSWEALGKGIPTRATWNKVHPNQDMTAYMDRMGELVDRPRVDVVKLVEVIQK